MLTPSNKRSRNGFTLLEVMLVLAILVVLLGIAVPAINRMYGDMRLDAAGDQIRAQWSTARARAMKDSVPYRFAVQPETGNYKVAPASAEFWPESDLPEGYAEVGLNNTRPYVNQESLPDEILFELGAGPPAEGVWVPLATFMPDGTCLEDVTLLLGSPGYNPVRLELRGLTGSVHTGAPAGVEG